MSRRADHHQDVPNGRDSPDTAPPPRSEWEPGLGCLGAVLGGLSAVGAWISAWYLPCDGISLATVLFYILPILTAVLISGGLVLGTRRADDRQRRKVLKVVGSITVGVGLGGVALLITGLIAVSKCLTI